MTNPKNKFPIHTRNFTFAALKGLATHKETDVRNNVYSMLPNPKAIALLELTAKHDTSPDSIAMHVEKFKDHRLYRTYVPSGDPYDLPDPSGFAESILRDLEDYKWYNDTNIQYATNDVVEDYIGDILNGYAVSVDGLQLAFRSRDRLRSTISQINNPEHPRTSLTEDDADLAADLLELFSIESSIKLIPKGWRVTDETDRRIEHIQCMFSCVNSMLSVNNIAWPDLRKLVFTALIVEPPVTSPCD